MLSRVTAKNVGDVFLRHSVVSMPALWLGNNAATGGGERSHQQSTSRWRGGGADRYRGPSYDAYNDAAHQHHHPRHPDHSQQRQQQPSQLWYPTTNHNAESPTSSSSSSSTSAAADSAGSRRPLATNQRQRLHGGIDDGDDDDVRFFVAFTFILELVVIIGLALLEYFLRFVQTLLTVNLIHREPEILIGGLRLWLCTCGHTPRSSANGLNHTCLCIPSRSWYSFTDLRGMEGWVGLDDDDDW